MAAISLSPLPVNLSSMSTRRVPLQNNPNAANSPYRAVAAAAAASKQKRSYATIQREESYGQPPPAKKQMLDGHHTIRAPSLQQNSQLSAEGRVFTRKSNASQPSAFERQCMTTVRERAGQQHVTKAAQIPEENQDIRQWQKHYRRIFPKFIFYFESVPEEVRLKYSKQVISLGAVSSILFIVLKDYSNANALIAGGKVLFERGYSRCHNSSYSSGARCKLNTSCSFFNY
jgi:hypothetical protein